MSDSLKARPTEYEGVVFRSKSEAMFARLLDMMNSDWAYEPDYMAVDGWLPDFVIPAVEEHFHVILLVVEYKPSNPTETYINEFAGRISRLSRIWEFSMCEIRGVVCWINWFGMNTNSGAYIIEDGGCAIREADQWEPLFMKGAYAYRDEIRNYRFDLVKGGQS